MACASFLILQPTVLDLTLSSILHQFQVVSKEAQDEGFTIYLQLLSVSGDFLLHPQQETP